MTATRERVIETFQEEHRQTRDKCLELSDAIEAGDLDRAEGLVREIDAAAGPHFQYEEDALYPALIPFFGEEKVKELVAEHDEAIEAAETLAELTGQDSLSEAEKQEALRALPNIMVHVSDCDGLTVYLEKADDAVFEDIAQSMDEASEQGLTLTEYDRTVRPTPEEIVA
ncbi:hemerythrin domain-containing protein [Haloarcula laminariae]|uniref:hemerythrin domain-containing protein n=1 Tax=Haloarcula laminariae TaxID=2961577 RepID=UPI002406EC0F|nr:hemerythrin domain-containing protein [Halomicroarcula sp. FL173]